MLTPAFHFKILEKYVDVFNANGSILCENLAKEAGGKAFDVYEYIKLYALDNICGKSSKLFLAIRKIIITYFKTCFWNTMRINDLMIDWTRDKKNKKESLSTKNYSIVGASAKL